MTYARFLLLLRHLRALRPLDHGIFGSSTVCVTFPLEPVCSFDWRKKHRANVSKGWRSIVKRRSRSAACITPSHLQLERILAIGSRIAVASRKGRAALARCSTTLCLLSRMRISSTQPRTGGATNGDDAFGVALFIVSVEARLQYVRCWRA